MTPTDIITTKSGLTATLYLAESAGALAGIAASGMRWDVVIADPPYGVSGRHNTRSAQRKAGKKNGYLGSNDEMGYAIEVASSVFGRAMNWAKRGVVTPGNRCLTAYPPPDSFGCIYQPASVGLQPWGRADSQPILYYGKHPVGGRALPSSQCSYQCTEQPSTNEHPCAKPMSLWERIVKSASIPGETILDPFMGSGTTGVAALRHGCNFIGVEIESKYYEIAKRRIAAEAAQGRLFV